MQIPAADVLLKYTLGMYAAGIAGALLFNRSDRSANFVGFLCAFLGGCLGIATSLVSLWPGGTATVSFELWQSFVPYVHWGIKLDALGAFFLLILSTLSVGLSLYSFGYVKTYYGRKPVGVLGAFFNALLLATTLVFTASNAFFFLIVWEIMALTAFCLVSYEHERDETRKGGVLYFIMSHVGTGCLILAFLLLFQVSDDYGFDSFHNAVGAMSPGKRNMAFILFLVGFGIKAGIVPLHIWLPEAHPVAPSNVSALLSGVLIKTGIYGLTRVLFDWLGSPPNWWGVTLLAIGTISAVLGVLYALMEHDLKRLLAYHSIENIGIILMGLGASVVFLQGGETALAALALVAGLYHTINHAIFKALLFLGAGAVLHSTHTRNMEELGGLIKRMPKTAFFFLAGSIAISALPPLNGFVSEWLTYQALLQGYQPSANLVRLVFPLSGAMLALTGALAAACFVKAFGITFLAQPRTKQAREAREARPAMLLSMGLLTVICVFLGLFPTLFLRVFDTITRQFTGEALSGELSIANGLVLGNTQAVGGTVSTLGIALMGVCLIPVPFALWWVLGKRAGVRIGPTWDCGLRGLTPQMEYTATGFSKPIRMIFKALFRPHREVQREYDYSPYFAKTLRFESHIEEAFVTRLYRPLNRGIVRLSRRMRAVQAGSIQAYLIYIFVTLIALLLFAL